MLSGVLLEIARLQMENQLVDEVKQSNGSIWTRADAYVRDNMKRSNIIIKLTHLDTVANKLK